MTQSNVTTKPSLTVIMPAYNEVRNLRSAYESVIRILQKADIFNYEIIITTSRLREGNRDETTHIANMVAEQNKHVKSLYYDHYVGLGYKYHKAVQAATKDYVVLIPGDGEFEEDSVVGVLRHIGEAELIITYPANPKVRTLKRRFVSKGFIILCNILFRLNLRYYNGLNILPRKYLQKVPTECNNFAYMAEILIYLLKSGVNYIEIPFGIKPSVHSSAFRFKSIWEAVATLTVLFWKVNFLRRRVTFVA